MVDWTSLHGPTMRCQMVATALLQAAGKHGRELESLLATARQEAAAAVATREEQLAVAHKKVDQLQQRLAVAEQQAVAREAKSIEEQQQLQQEVRKVKEQLKEAQAKVGKLQEERQQQQEEVVAVRQQLESLKGEGSTPNIVPANCVYNGLMCKACGTLAMAYIGMP